MYDDDGEYDPGEDETFFNDDEVIHPAVCRLDPGVVPSYNAYIELGKLLFTHRNYRASRACYKIALQLFWKGNHQEMIKNTRPNQAEV